MHENLALDQDGKLTEKKKRGTGRGRGGKRGKKEPTTSISCELPGEPRVTRSGRVTRSSVRQGTASLSQGYLEEEEDFPWGQEPNLREISSFQKTSHSLESGFSGMDLDQSEEEEEVPQKGRGRGGAKGRGRGTRGGGRKKAASSRTVGPKKKPTPRSTSSKSNVKKASSSQEDGDEEKQQDVNALFREKIRALGVPEMRYFLFRQLFFFSSTKKFYNPCFLISFFSHIFFFLVMMTFSLKKILLEGEHLVWSGEGHGEELKLQSKSFLSTNSIPRIQ